MMIAPLAVNRRRAAVVKSDVVQAPTGGLDASSPLAAMPADRAVELTNWFPQPGYIEVRRGFNYHAWDLTSDTTPVRTLMVWQGMSSSKMFAAAGANIYDVTSEGVGTSSASSLTDPAWQWVNFVNSAATYLYCVNGSDPARHYNGSTWAEPSITGAASSDFIHVNVHKKRLWFVQKNSTKAWYLAVDAIAGAANSLELGSVFTRGGYLMAMATWTRDGGSGPDDYAVFVSSRGQLALYAGTDPSSANTWALLGVFDAPPPIGRRCFTRFGADVLLVTLEGVYPLSQVLSVDQSQVRGVAITANIQNAIVNDARSYKGNFGWESVVYNKGTMLIVNVPVAEYSDSHQYVMNTLTGAWCKFDGMASNSWVVYEDKLYFGGNNGSVYEADTGSADVNDPITAVAQFAYQAFKSPGNLKQFKMLQALYNSSSGIVPSLGISTDFNETTDLSTSTNVGATGLALWDDADWDVEKWGGSISTTADWVSIPALGRFASIKIQVQTGTQTLGFDGGYWGEGTWADALWGGTVFNSDEEMKINGCVLLYEVGGHL